MATTETKVLDNIIASRRALLAGGGAALAALAMPKVASAAATVTSYSDADILNFALQLEYLEANFYYLAAFGTTIDKPNTASNAATGAAATNTTGIALTGFTGPVSKPVSATAGTVTTKPGGPLSCLVPFALPAVKAYAIETAVEEGKHVSLLRAAVGASAVAAQPAIDLYTAFNTLANAAGIGATFDPFASDANFLIGAYIFEDVGVTAYHGAAPLITQTATGKSILSTAAGILAVEAYHAGLIRSTINTLDPTGSIGYIGYTQKISTLRATLSKAVGPASSTYETYPDDIPLTPGTTTFSLGGAATTTGATVVDADQTNLIAFTRNTTQVLNIVTGGGAATAGVPATGVFFPTGLNGLFV